MEKQVTVVIADDSSHFRESLKVVLSHMTNIVIAGEAQNGEEAILLANALEPDIILMDINMPVVNGFEATRKILKHNPAQRVIGLSLHREVSYCKNLLKLGAKGYIVKTTPYEEILLAIEEVLAGRKYIDKDLRDIM